MRVFKKLKENKTKLYLFYISIALLGFHIYQFIDSGFLVYPLLRIIGFSCIIINLLFLPDCTTPYFIYGFALLITQTISFENYTPFILVIVAYTMVQKYFSCFMLLYLLDVVIVCIRHGKDPVHLLIHVLNCIILYALITLAMNKVMKEKRLDLTKEEEKILFEIVANGKRLKEIEGYKENTVSKKLKVMRMKNYCTTNKELYKRYRINMEFEKVENE